MQLVPESKPMSTRGVLAFLGVFALNFVVIGWILHAWLRGGCHAH